MKQILQNLLDGTTEVAEVPAPMAGRNQLLVRTSCSLVSAGTERVLVDFGKANFVDKARQQPEKVRRALQKMQTDGIWSTVDAVRSKLDEPLALGYCNVGQVLGVGEGVTGFAAGDRVVSNGRHAEIVAVPRLLAARIPEQLDDDAAVFAVLGAIALQGVRLAKPTIGETFVVTGLGLIGLLAVQILIANGCRVLGVDTQADRLSLARRFGAITVDLSKDESPLERAAAFSRGRGVDGVLITASTSSSEPVSQAARMCRKRGRIILVGVAGLELNRADFYEKELSFQVSCSYGPGRYDPVYEEMGHDYPIGFVRWTEQRNFEAVLDLIASGALDVKPLITHRFSIDDAPRAYDLLASSEPSLGIVIQYSARAATAHVIDLAAASTRLSSKATTGFIGAGNYGGRVLIGAFESAGASLHTVVSAKGVSAARYGRKFGFRRAASDVAAVFSSPEIDTVCISTRHDTHVALVRTALQAGKHVFVEKPLCLTLDELADIEGDLLKLSETQPLLMVGFNRRFAPMIEKMKELLGAVSEPKSFVMTVNAGAITEDHWTQDPVIGGGRIIGEACHFIDLLRHLANAPIRSFDVTGLKRAGGPPRTDTASITLKFENGSIGVLNYFANGHRSFPKERLDVFCAGRILVLDNFRRLYGYGWRGFSTMRSWRQDKGQAACVAAFVNAVRQGSKSPIPLSEILEVSRVSIDAAERAG